MSSPEIAELMADTRRSLSEARNLLLESQNIEDADPKTQAGLRKKALSIIEEMRNNIKESLPSLQTNLQQKMMFVELQDSAISLAFLIYLVEDDIDSIRKISGSVPKSKLEFPTFSIALKAVQLFIAESESAWPWLELENIIKQYDSEVYNAASETGRFDLWVVVLFSGVLSKDWAIANTACDHLSTLDNEKLYLLANLATALDNEKVGWILRNSDTELLEFYQKKTDAITALELYPNRYDGWKNLHEYFLSINREDLALYAHKLTTLASKPPIIAPVRRRTLTSIERKERDSRIQGARELMQQGRRSDSDLLRGLALAIEDAGGPEAFVDQTDVAFENAPAMLRGLEIPRSHGLCPQCRAIIAEYVRRYTRGLHRSEIVVCPSCNNRLQFDAGIKRKLPQYPVRSVSDPTDCSLGSCCALAFFIPAFMLNPLLGIFLVIIYSCYQVYQSE